MTAPTWQETSPKSWPRIKIKYACRFVGGGTPDKSNAAYWGGDIPWVSPKDMKTFWIQETEDHITEEGLQDSATKLIEPGALLIVMRSGILRHSIPVAINRVPVTVNQDLRALLPSSALDVRFLGRFLEGFQRELLCHLGKEGATVESLESDLLGNCEICLPSAEQQNAITAFLDREVTRLDELVAAKEHQIDLLAEKRRALVSKAVLRGVKDNAPLRDTGIPWLGQIPAHWQTERCAWLFKERDERGEPELPLLEVSINSGVALREFSDDRIESTATDFNTYKVARQGNLVFNKMRMWQGAVGIAPVDGLVSPDYTVASISPRLIGEYVSYLMRTEAFSAECARESHGITWDRLRLYWDGFREIRVPVPDAGEQEAVVRFIAREAGRLDALQAATRRSIDLLKERRSALIAAAVTGQIPIPPKSIL